MKIIGISAFYHDSAACLIDEGKLIASQEERFTRKKHDASFPENAIKSCLAQAKLNPSDIDYIVFYDKPLLKFERLLESYISFAPIGLKSFLTAMPVWLKEKLFLKDLLIKSCKNLGLTKDEDKYLFTEHHISHAASAFFPSPFNKAYVLTLDGVGEWATTQLSYGEGNKLKPIKEIHFPHSLGLLYSAFTQYLGFKVNSGEYKVMGLAPYGKPLYTDLIKDNIFKQFDDGSFILEMKYFSYATGLSMVNKKFVSLFGKEIRKEEDKLEQFHMDVAASIQSVCEEAVLNIVQNIHDTEMKKTGCFNLCLAGGVALNCVANGKILKKFSDINLWIQPAAGDAGGSLGACMHAYYHHFEHKRGKKENKIYNPCADEMNGAYLGPSFSPNQIEEELKNNEAVFEKYDLAEITHLTAKLMSEGKSVGWFQEKMEFGPRALGNRSIIADPRGSDVQKTLNLKIKFRESFRPFAPSVLAEYMEEFFDLSVMSPYMLLVAQIKDDKKIMLKDENLFGLDLLNQKRSVVPAITHVDFSARVQTIHKETNPIYHNLISEFHKITNIPLIVNTSFNIRGEPIICTPTNAFNCFMGTGLDVLVCGNYILYKDKQTKEQIDYRSQFKLD